jgi:hypothetical protein
MDRPKNVCRVAGQLGLRAELVVVLLAWSLSAPSLAGGPDHDAFSGRDGHIATAQHHLAALALIRNPDHLDAVSADAASGNPGAVPVFQELERELSGGL